jgi:hypothetical protein
MAGQHDWACKHSQWAYKSPCNDQIPAEPIQGGGETLRSGIHKLINSIWNNKEDLPDQWKESITEPIHKAIKLTVVITVGYHC